MTVQFRTLPAFGGDPRAVAEIVNGIMNGKTNNTGLVTLATGLLWPLETTIDADEDDGEFDDEDDSDAAKVAVFGQMKPSTMGISFAINYSLENLFTAKYSFAAYCLVENDNLKDKNELWQRIPFDDIVTGKQIGRAHV